MELTLPLDADGFLLRSCPSCEETFKWFDGETDATPEDWIDPEQYHCPYCGHAADGDAWFTTDQINYIESAAMKQVSDDLGDMMKGLERRGPGISVSVDAGSTPAAAPLQESLEEWTIVEPPCHPFEPIKVDMTDEPLHCLVCGEGFRI